VRVRSEEKGEAEMVSTANTIEEFRASRERVEDAAWWDETEGPDTGVEFDHPAWVYCGRYVIYEPGLEWHDGDGPHVTIGYDASWGEEERQFPTLTEAERWLWDRVSGDR
jgi:hypothetical protein